MTKLNNNNTDEFSISLSTNPPHILCLMDHHLRNNELDSIALTNYNLGAKFCRSSFKNGVVHIFTHESIQLTNVSLIKFCKEKDLKICAVKLHLFAYTICIVAIYRYPSRNF